MTQRYGVIRDRRSETFGFAIWDYRYNRYHAGEAFEAMTLEEATKEAAILNEYEAQKNA